MLCLGFEPGAVGWQQDGSTELGIAALLPGDFSFFIPTTLGDF